ncbi:peptidase M24, structural domain-containing protein [Aspergillus tamarii]|uniref:Xaa-Pro aminopeptidase n=1 Tax=Aspergillus tamarii TaxID=41984 RepID=A0A5N6V613_ASPTM|nr:peptidase M24, structural domain-containing protein [Aspergillus tamarii]
MSTCKLLTRQWPRYLRCPTSRISITSFNRTAFQTRPTLHRAYGSISAAELKFGQPLHETHPHILNPGELTPGITALEYAHRRSRLANRLPKYAIAVLSSAEVTYRASGIFNEYRQDSNFFYLTGFNEPNALAIIANDGSGDNHIFHLYVREKDPKAELWDGARSGTRAAIDVFNADETGDIEHIGDILPRILSDATEIYTDIPSFNPGRSSLHRYLYGPTGTSEQLKKVVDHSKVRPLRHILNDMRVFKSEDEVVQMRRVGQASGRAFTESMRQTFTKEKDLTSFLEYNFKVKGCDTSAFVPVVAGGSNALSIHYTRNDDVLRDGDMVLVDGGGETGTYVSDITRTWPVNGEFSDPQRDLYNAVLNVQRTCVSLCRESANVSLDKLHTIAENGLRDQLQQLGFDVSGNAMGVLFPHHLGHYVGLDVHDCPGYSRGYNLKAGQCITVEPGIYVPDSDRWPEKFRGIGIRIEDSVCVGDDSPIVLTTEAVKEVDDIEALRG